MNKEAVGTVGSVQYSSNRADRAQTDGGVVVPHVSLELFEDPRSVIYRPPASSSRNAGQTGGRRSQDSLFAPPC